MTTQAENVLNKLNFIVNTHMYNAYYHQALDNNDLHDLLNDEANYVTEILGQETWVMSDGSYITRNIDGYFFDVDVTDFEVTEELQA